MTHPETTTAADKLSPMPPGRMSWDYAAACMRADPEGPYVAWTDMQDYKAHLEAQGSERSILEEVLKLLQRAPKATNAMFVGADREPWGKQAKALVKRIEAAFRVSGEQS